MLTKQERRNFVEKESEDSRIVCGASNCVWWDHISNASRVKSLGRDMMSCPHCGNVSLMSFKNEKEWWAVVDKRASTVTEDYRAFIEWIRGKCYPSIAVAKKAWEDRLHVN